MGFWIYMLAMNLLLPLTMIFCGRYFSHKAPKEINCVFGYRTSMSMKNKDTWEYAHKLMGKLWYKCGIAMLPVSVLAMLFVLGKGEAVIGTVGAVACGVQVVVMVLTILPVERALRKKFDENGNERIK